MRISMTLFLLACLNLSKQQEPPFQFKLIDPGVPDTNLIVVECFESKRGQGNDDAFIWLNDTSLASLTRVDSLTLRGHFRFVITRDLEGNYTCGTQEDSVNRLESEPKRLVGKSLIKIAMHRLTIFFFDCMLNVEYLSFTIGWGGLVFVINSCNQLLALLFAKYS